MPPDSSPQNHLAQPICTFDDLRAPPLQAAPWWAYSGLSAFLHGYALYTFSGPNQENKHFEGIYVDTVSTCKSCVPTGTHPAIAGQGHTAGKSGKAATVCSARQADCLVSAQASCPAFCMPDKVRWSRVKLRGTGNWHADPRNQYRSTIFFSLFQGLMPFIR
jgi:hypothetical protein